MPFICLLIVEVIYSADRFLDVGAVLNLCIIGIAR